ncbi:MAG: sigma-54-dependent Fis family transcriptional regulator [Deltaproteobacteria bacterium]|nr:sigma-54-dependent Fis family transcriptional regulator [Deltaproteobacteria bacterium]
MFPQAVPSLSDLAQDIFVQGRSFSNLRIRLVPGGPGVELTAFAQPEPHFEDSLQSGVQFFFQELRFKEAEAPQVFQGMVGVSPATLEVFRKIKLYGPSDASVVITGETGTGKELVARALHNESPRSSRPYVAVNCSAISKELLESELFGHEKGAFTGALRTHKGRFERAQGGSIFLDEVGDMPLSTQVKLLRVLENRTIERVGSERETPIDVRVICATNVSLEKDVAAGRFRSDLYHRLAILRIHLPSLRERIEDIPFLTSHFLGALNSKYRKNIKRLTPEATNLLQSYLWPGNIRELKNVLERIVVETEGEVVGARAFRDWVRERQQLSPERWEDSSRGKAGADTIIPPIPLTSGHPLLNAPEDQVVQLEVLPPQSSFSKSTCPSELDEETFRRAYRAAAGNISEMARRLGVHRATVYRYLRKFDLGRKDLDC